MDLVPIRRALISVSDKTGLTELAATLAGFGVELVSTGGTRQALAAAGLTVRDISEVTGFPEILDGRVKTLHPAVHAGLLARRDLPDHVITLRQHGLRPFDLVVVNLYPFEQTVARGAAADEVIENIDIGGPSMLRSAAKNHAAVAVVTDPAQYEAVAAELKERDGSLSLATRRKLAAAAFARTAAYDSAVAAWFAGHAQAEESARFPLKLNLTLDRKATLRYGENPHQAAAFYAEPGATHASVSTAEIMHGKELSYNNILDLDAALGLVREFSQPAAVVIKHTNPCGAAVGATLEEAFRKAYDGDPVSAYGGILAFNRPLDPETAMQISEPGRFVECIIAPNFEPVAFEVLTTRPTWRKNVRLLRTGPLTAAAGQLDYRRVDGGLLVQERDPPVAELDEVKVVTKRPPTEAELADLLFAVRVCKHVKSNAIVYAKGGQIVGVGAGQMSRLDSVKIGAEKAGDRAKGTALASDAFFPFRDGVDAAAAAGVTAIIQPGGSMRDAESIAACDERDVAMVFTSRRHFRH